MLSQISQFATSTFQFIKNGGPVYLDAIVLLGLFFILFFYGFYFGREKIISFLIAFYPSAFLYKLFPFSETLLVFKGPISMVLNQIAVFLLFFLPLNVIVARYIFKESYGDSHIWGSLGYALGGTVLFLVFSYGLVSLDVFHDFSPIVDTFFAGTRVFWWSLAPIFLLAIL